MMYAHDVQFVKRLGAARAFPHAVADAVVDALVAKEVTASLERGILKVISTYAAQGKGLMKKSASESKALETRTTYS